MAVLLLPPTSRGIREADPFGSGHFGTPRGDRLHRGVDFLAEAGEEVVSPAHGRVRRIGFCYADDPSFRLVEIVGVGFVLRLLYVEPVVAAGDPVVPGMLVGRAQNVASRYDYGMRNHVHLELRLATALLGRGREAGESVWIDPTLLMGE